MSPNLQVPILHAIDSLVIAEESEPVDSRGDMADFVLGDTAHDAAGPHVAGRFETAYQ